MKPIINRQKPRGTFHIPKEPVDQKINSFL